VQIQRKKKVLLNRLKVPSALNRFLQPLDKDNTKKLFEALASYRPETKAEKAERLKGKARQEILKLRTNADKAVKLKFGLNHVTYLIEQKRAKLVVIAADVDPIEMVVFLPTLCRTMDIPFCIVPSKSRLGALVNQKNATCVALTQFTEKAAELNSLARVCKELFNDTKIISKKPGQGVKSIAREKKLEEAKNKEMNKAMQG
jgi:large subunit ribosomal protein L7Ae